MEKKREERKRLGKTNKFMHACLPSGAGASAGIRAAEGAVAVAGAGADAHASSGAGVQVCSCAGESAGCCTCSAHMERDDTARRPAARAGDELGIGFVACVRSFVAF